MKKKILSFILAVCFIIPCMLMIVGCKKQTSKYADIVKQINSDTAFAQLYMDKLLDDNLKNDIEITYSDSQSVNLTKYILNRSHNSFYYEELEESGWFELIMFEENLYYTAHNLYFGVGQANEEYNYLDCVKISTCLGFIEDCEEFSAKDCGNFFNVETKYIDGQIQRDLTIKIKDGMIKEIAMKNSGVWKFKLISENRYYSVNDEKFANVDEIRIGNQVDATDLDMNLFEKMNNVVLGVDVILPEDAELYLADYFLETEDRHYERHITEE